MSLPSIHSPIPGPQSRQLAERLRQVESPGITYLADDFPVFWERAQGANIWDVDGNCYLDLNSAFGVAGFGHSHPKIASALASQVLQLVHGMGDVHPPRLKVEFLEKLQSILPSQLSHMIMSCNGSDACESALKTAQLYTGKPGVIAFEFGYHGLGYGALDLTHKPHFRSPFEKRLTEYTYHAPYPNPLRHGANALHNSLEAVREILDQKFREIGAIIVEPIQGRGGVIVPPKGFLAGLREICNEYGLLLILDEIYTGFGRTGRLFAFEHEQILPDLLCLGKAIGGGLPLSLCIGSAEVMRAWKASNGEAIHTSTFLGNPLACVAGLIILDDLRNHNWVQRNHQTGEEFLAKLKTLNSPFIGEVRGKGMMLGVELVKDKNTLEPYTDLANFILTEGLRKGLILLTSGSQGQVLSISPPFMISRAEIDFAVGTLQELLDHGKVKLAPTIDNQPIYTLN
ncbi:MAG: aspartate aminotransferase family protein [Candidatus Caenarcaniphilales bacterium]|nr:aspartate aminotransferase family protein [Candidatus Caenarcaniphilales bacterium]